MCRERDAAEERTASHFEGRIRAKTREVAQLREQVHRLAHSGARGDILDAPPGATVTLSVSEFESLRREMREQEALIQVRPEYL